MSYPSYLHDYEVFPYPPLAGQKETLRTETNIIKGRDGSEQRISIRPAPRQSFDFDVFLNDRPAMARLDALLFGWQKRHWALPIWAEKELHTDVISGGTSTIAFDTACADYRAGTLAIIWKSETEFEVIKVSEVYPTYLSLDGTVQATWSGDKLIMPCRLVQMLTPATGRQASRYQAHRSFSFGVVDNVLLTGHVPDETYPDISGAESWEVVTQPSMVADGEESQSDAEFLVQDYGAGQFQFVSDSDYNVLSRSYRRRVVGKSACWVLRLWLHSFYGRQVPKWFPTFKNDVSPLATIGASDISFVIENIGLSTNMGLNSLRTHLTFTWPDGTMAHRQIIDISEDTSGDEVVTLDSSLGQDFEPMTGIASFLDLCRLDSDSVEIRWSSGYEAECRLGLAGVAA